jgi:hypothetical protein
MNIAPGNLSVGTPGLPGYPDMPAEEVERLLGIRRPVYIPATGNKRKLRVGSWRVISGVLSIMVICLASCAATSFFGKKYLDGMSQAAHINATPATIDYSVVPATPVATAGAQGVNGGVGAKYVTSVTTAKRIDNSINPIGVTSHFLIGDTVYVVVNVRSAPQGQNTVCINWYLNGQYLQLPSSAETCKSISTPNQNVAFYIAYPQAAVGMARVYWDRPATDLNTGADDPALAETIVFGVYAPGVPTGVPGTPTGSPSSGPTPTKTP